MQRGIFHWLNSFQMLSYIGLNPESFELPMLLVDVRPPAS